MAGRSPHGALRPVLAVRIMQPGVPKTFEEAMKMPDADLWCDATKKSEMQSLIGLEVFQLIPRSNVPPGRKVISSRWVFRRKAGNSKARAVAQGWNQVQGLHCGSTSAPVCRLQSIRMALAIAAEMDWEVK